MRQIDHRASAGLRDSGGLHLIGEMGGKLAAIGLSFRLPNVDFRVLVKYIIGNIFTGVLAQRGGASRGDYPGRQLPRHGNILPTDGDFSCVAPSQSSNDHRPVRGGVFPMRKLARLSEGSPVAETGRCRVSATRRSMSCSLALALAVPDCAPQGLSVLDHRRDHLREHQKGFEWFRVVHLMLTSKKGMSASQIQRVMGFGSYETA